MYKSLFYRPTDCKCLLLLFWLQVFASLKKVKKSLKKLLKSSIYQKPFLIYYLDISLLLRYLIILFSEISKHLQNGFFCCVFVIFFSEWVKINFPHWIMYYCHCYYKFIFVDIENVTVPKKINWSQGNVSGRKLNTDFSWETSFL